MLKNPCYSAGVSCTERTAECHGICPKYIAFEKENALNRAKKTSEIELYKSDGQTNYHHKMKFKQIRRP